jgi:hypothetical protein
MSADLACRDQAVNYISDSDDLVDGPTLEQKIFREMKERLTRRQTKKKVQPWKQTHSVAPEDLPSTSGLLHEKPWYNEDEFPEAGDSTHGA